MDILLSRRSQLDRSDGGGSVGASWRTVDSWYTVKKKKRETRRRGIRSRWRVVRAAVERCKVRGKLWRVCGRGREEEVGEFVVRQVEASGQSVGDDVGLSFYQLTAEADGRRGRDGRFLQICLPRRESIITSPPPDVYVTLREHSHRSLLHRPSALALNG